MKKRQRYPRANNCYKPSKAMTSTMTKLLQYKNKEELLEEKIISGGVTDDEAIKKEKRDLRDEKIRLNREKVHLLNKHIFPGMANLTVFLEYVLEDPYLHGIFQDDLKSLLFAKSTKNRDKAPIYLRFLRGACKSVIRKPDKVGKMVDVIYPDFRLALCDLTQKAIYESISNIASFKFSQSFKLKDDEFLHKTLYADVDRAGSWSSMLAEAAWEHLEYDKETRPPLF